MLAQHWRPFLILASFAIAIFIPNMLKKDKSLSRYPEFEQYHQNSGLLLPKLWGKIPDSNPSAIAPNNDG
ncbi:hypothetical protein ACOKW7_08885 [Limnospira platensis CENA597]|uniref:hypothetical protein n=1 Tax=Limnospira platensis TaxID=118562 RepID=UPI003DA1B98C